MKRLSILAFSLFLALAAGWAQPLSLPALADMLPPGSSWVPGSLFMRVDTGKGSRPTMKPAGFDIADPAASPVPESGKPVDKALRIEALVLLPASADSALAKSPSQSALSETLGKLALILGSVHTMEGIEYWSASRQVMRTLYAEAHRLDSPSGKAALPDPLEVPSNPGSSATFHAYLRDLTFGGNVMEYTVKIGRTSIAMTNVNATTMRYYLLPLVPPGGMKSSILIVPCREGLLVHFLTTIDSIDLMAGRVFESAGNKALAVLGWFARETVAAGLTKESGLPRNIEDVERLK